MNCMDLYQRITKKVDDLRQDQIREMGLVNADGLPSTEALVDQIIEIEKRCLN